MMKRQIPKCTVCHHCVWLSLSHGQRQGMTSRTQHQTVQSDLTSGLWTWYPANPVTVYFNPDLMFIKYVLLEFLLREVCFSCMLGKSLTKDEGCRGGASLNLPLCIANQTISNCLL